MGKPSIPDPQAVARAQTGSNIQTAIANTIMGNADTYTPFGATEYNQTGNKVIQVAGHPYAVPTYDVHQTLTPDQQRLLNLQEQAGANLGRTAVNETDFMKNYLSQQMDTSTLPHGVQSAARADNLQLAQSPDDFSADRQRVANDMYARLNPQLQHDQSALDQRLANQGIAIDSEAWRRAQTQQGQKSNDLRTQVDLASGQEQDRLYNLAMQQANQANAVTQGNFQNASDYQQSQQTLHQQALQEQIAQRNQPLSEVSQLLTGSQPTIPQFQQFQAGHVADTPIGQYIYQSAAMQNQSNNASMGGMFGLGSSLLGALPFLSDRRTKENIKQIDTLRNGLPLYLFNYIGDPAPRMGLMAQDVEKVHPNAVIEINGLKHVYYEMAVL